MSDPMRALLGQRPPTLTEGMRWFTAQVSDSHAGGVYVTELDQDTSAPHRVRWGATYRDTSTCPGGEGGHAHPLLQLPRGATVLAIETPHGVWVVHHDEGSLPA